MEYNIIVLRDKIFEQGGVFKIRIVKKLFKIIYKIRRNYLQNLSKLFAKLVQKSSKI